MCFANKKPVEERVQVLFSGKERTRLSQNSPNVFKKSNIEICLERTCSIFGNGKYSVLNESRFAEFLAYYTIENKYKKIFD